MVVCLESERVLVYSDLFGVSRSAGKHQFSMYSGLESDRNVGEWWSVCNWTECWCVVVCLESDKMLEYGGLFGI